MGLDMYAYTAPAELVGDQQVDLEDKLFDQDGNKREGVDTDFAYWRKFNILHGWMERLYRKKGGAQDSFNCTTVRLDPEDLDQLEADAKSGDNMTPTQGFFFGGAEPFNDDDRQEILAFVERAGEAQDAGLVVLYSSWW